MSSELAITSNAQIQQAVARYNMMVEYVNAVMKPEKDYGKVPGTSKPTLLKPGAEKLVSLFELYPVMRAADKVLDWDKGLFFYQYECSLIHRKTGEVWGTGLGSCNSRESKYQYRKAERVCPKCGKSTIIKGNVQYGGGWLCWRKNGGCNAKFADGDQSIEGQQVGRVINPDIADLVNTIDKMAQKRALIAAALIACNASEFFTQDVEEIPGFGGDVTEGEYTEVKEPEQPSNNGNGKPADKPWNMPDFPADLPEMSYETASEYKTKGNEKHPPVLYIEVPSAELVFHAGSLMNTWRTDEAAAMKLSAIAAILRKRDKERADKAFYGQADNA